MTTVSIVYHSGSGHTAKLAEAVVAMLMSVGEGEIVHAGAPL